MPTVVPKLPQLPEDLKKRFPSVVKWEQDVEKWRQDLAVALGWINPQ